MKHDLVLYQGGRSSSSWRVRWGLALKGVEYRAELVDLAKREQDSPAFRKLNPLGQVPVLVIDGEPVSESLAILEWLDETYPTPPLLPRDPKLRAQTRQLALVIAAGTQPLQSLGILNWYSPDEAKRAEFARIWIEKGLQSYETLVVKTAGKFSVGDSVTLADLCLVPQVANADRFRLDLGPYPRIREIVSNCKQTKACLDTMPKAG